MRWFPALLVALLLFGSVAGVGVGQPADARASAVDASPHSVGPTANGTATNGTAHDGTTIRIALGDDGDARWNVSTRFRLRDENETAAFRQLATEYENGETDIGMTQETFERVANRAATDRKLTIKSVERSAHVDNNSTVGTLSLSFTWTNFTRVEGDNIVLHDAFATESGTWLPELNGDQTLVIEGPDGYVVWDSPGNMQQRNGTILVYQGPQSFEPGEIRVVYAPRSRPTTPGTGTPGTDWTDLSGLPGLVLLVFVVGAGSVGAYALTQRRDDPEVTEESRTEPTPAGPPGGSGERSERRADDGEEDDGDVELLSDEERVLRLLRKNDGRMKQAAIVEETNWSNAKVSQLLSKMDENGDVDKLRIGRENLITLPDEDVTDVD